MIEPREGEDAASYSSLPSDQQAFISEFNITGYNTEKHTPNYQAGDFCIMWEDHPDEPYVEGWVIRDCDSGRVIAEHLGMGLPKCLEGNDFFFFTKINKKIHTNFVCLTTTEAPTTQEHVETTKDTEAPVPPSTTTPEAPTTQEHVETTKDTGAPVPPSTTTSVAPTTQEHVETTKDTGAPVAPSTTTEASTTQEHVETTKKPCEPCRDVLEGDLAGYYELQSEDDPRCDDGCGYTNQHSQEFCFRPGGFETKLECHDPQ